MAAITPSAGYPRAARALLLLVTLCTTGSFFAGCDQYNSQPRQIDGLKADLDEARRRISHLQTSLSAKDAELAASTKTLETASGGVADLEKALSERSAQLQTAQAELDKLKKNEALAFFEIASTQGQGSVGLAVARYQKFVNDYPKSPLVTHANNAITQLTVLQQESTPPVAATSTSRAIAKIDPTASTRDFVKKFDQGYMTLQEIAPFLRKKTMAQVIALCGRPNQSYNEGTEIGYADRAINPVTGGRGILIVSFDAGTVATLRVEYGGRKITP
jgi:hypothetical protein